VRIERINLMLDDSCGREESRESEERKDIAADESGSATLFSGCDFVASRANEHFDEVSSIDPSTLLYWATGSSA
jgi:hypothetical protein